jgi:hypothetical protein
MPKSLNDITKEDLALVEDLASMFFTPREIAVMIEVNPNDAVTECSSEGNEFYNAFQKGRLQSEMELRKSIIKLAKSGSSPAQTMSLDLLNKSRVNK